MRLSAKNLPEKVLRPRFKGPLSAFPVHAPPVEEGERLGQRVEVVLWSKVTKVAHFSISASLPQLCYCYVAAQGKNEG